ncbi:MetS family NSS transporter small subunit [Caloramator fervidus]|nr:MetS family NSS transporter small subunit [Caloramator fervidus]
MDKSAIAMLIFGCTILFGGLTFFTLKAVKVEKKK